MAANSRERQRRLEALFAGLQEQKFDHPAHQIVLRRGLHSTLNVLHIDEFERSPSPVRFCD